MSILTIPKELQLHILGLLSVSELLRLSETCHGLKDLARDPCLWRKLSLSYKMIKNNTVACRNHVSRCSSLQELFITGKERSIRSDKIMSVVMRAKDSLTSFDISLESPGMALSNSSVIKFGKMIQLRKLSLVGTKIKPDGISALNKLTELTTLKVVGMGMWDCSEDYQHVKNLFTNLKRLEEVKISFGPFSDKVVDSLVTNNPNLKYLDLNSRFYRFVFYDENVGNTTVKNMIGSIADNCPQLTNIDLGWLDIIDNNDLLKLIAKCVNLQLANFEETSIEDSTLALMARNCPNLEHLKIAGCDMITEEGIEAFLNEVSQASLKFLDITECDFLFTNEYEDDNGNVDEDASERVGKRLVQEHPDIDIVYDNGDYYTDSEDSSDSDED